jgi:hypothetical protein
MVWVGRYRSAVDWFVRARKGGRQRGQLILPDGLAQTTHVPGLACEGRVVVAEAKKELLLRSAGHPTPKRGGQHG